MNWGAAVAVYLMIGLVVLGFVSVRNEALRDAFGKEGGSELVVYSIVLWPALLGAQLGKHGDEE